MLDYSLNNPVCQNKCDAIKWYIDKLKSLSLSRFDFNTWSTKHVIIKIKINDMIANEKTLIQRPND